MMIDRSTTNEHRRLSVLKHLARSADYVSNTSILHDVVNGVGISTTLDQLITTLHWLDEQELIRLEDKGEFSIAKASARGVDVALGRTTHPGVKRPSAV